MESLLVSLVLENFAPNAAASLMTIYATYVFGRREGHEAMAITNAKLYNMSD